MNVLQNLVKKKKKKVNVFNKVDIQLVLWY